MMDKQWMMVQNPGELEIWGIRLLGLSNKSSDQIGKFGTGLKETIALVFRLNSSLIIYSGTTCYNFSIKRRDGQNEIGFTIDDQEWQGMGLHPMFGKHDWNSAWQVLREIFCNAIDEGLSDLYYDMVNEVEGVAGCTRVFIECNNQIKNAFYTIDRKLLMLGDVNPICVTAAGNVYEKIGIGDSVQVYHKQVWIASFGAISLFDYDVDDLKITESRTTSESDVSDQVPVILANASEAVVIRLLLAIEDQGKDQKMIYEVWSGSYYHYNDAVRLKSEVKEVWKRAWFKAYGNDAVAIHGDQHQYDSIREMGKKPIVVKDHWIMILNCFDIPVHKTVLSQDQMDGRVIIGPMEGIHTTWKMLDAAGLTAGMNQPVITIYKETISNMKQGFVRERCVFINDAVLNSEQENIVMIEQFAKYISDAGECTMKLEGWLYTALYTAMEGADG